MKTAIWFGRSQPTKPQLQEASQLGYSIEKISKGRRLAHRPLKTVADLKETATRLRSLALGSETHVIFGVFPPPLLEELRGFDLYAPWNVESRGEFLHRRWCDVSQLPVAEPTPVAVFSL